MIVLIGGEKGGTGKTTVATALAVMHALGGRDVLLVDTDKQGSATTWALPRVAVASQNGTVQARVLARSAAVMVKRRGSR